MGPRRWFDVIVVALYCTLALIYFWSDWFGGLKHLTSGSIDGVQMTWFFFDWVRTWPRFQPVPFVSGEPPQWCQLAQ